MSRSSGASAESSDGEFEPLRQIGGDIHFHEPATSTPPSRGPSLVVVFTWLGGSTPRRIQKYLTGYRSLWPDTSILLITSRMMEFSALPVSFLRSRLASGGDVVRRHVDKERRAKREPSVLFHIFSNGGLYSAVHLALLLQHPHRDDPPLKPEEYIGGLILDCCPGQTEFQRTYTAATFALPSMLPAQLLGKPFFFILVGLTIGLAKTGIISGVNYLRQNLNDPAVFGSSAARLYLYSKADEIVGWQDVESHMEEAQSTRGYRVEGVEFPNGLHCALVRSNEPKYWASIEEFWDGKGQPSPPSPLPPPPRSRL